MSGNELLSAGTANAIKRRAQGTTFVLRLVTAGTIALNV